jgi:REP element-mobilizing transposase RayT
VQPFAPNTKKTFHETEKPRSPPLRSSYKKTPKAFSLTITKQSPIIFMGQSLVKNYLHIIFSTKHRQKLISSVVEQELFQYMAGICKRLDCPPLKIGGHEDHVHLLCMLSKKIALMKLLEEVKSHSSKWMKSFGNEFSNFYWQDGYGAFSVNPAEVETVIDYIAHQREHHQSACFQREYRGLLKKYEVAYDEKYVWD